MPPEARSEIVPAAKILDEAALPAPRNADPGVVLGPVRSPRLQERGTRVGLGIAGIAVLGIGALAAILAATPRPAPAPIPEPTYELVTTCKGPLMRRNLEQVVRRNDGKRFYKDDRGVLTPIADDVRLDDVCRSTAKKFWQ